MTRDPLFQSPKLTRPPPREKRRVGEVAGGAAAECAAVCCCCPCSVMNLLILAVYKVPKGLCMKAWAHRKRKRRCAVQKKGRLGGGGDDDDDDGKRASGCTEGDGEKKSNAETEGADLLEKEMWDRFHGAGFWRSASRRES
ncbi:uncharacterized protein LOC103967087 [Pyrus x bretschneideri]|uniref:uncharacterized protein LOC103967087 n=1 Tax=Pyrus x bretschneideri TaxID=225117 RepID=UPI00202FA42F|nr:uncharacterized protein LOC103967087 [Pyrus x bretschneideri]